MSEPATMPDEQREPTQARVEWEPLSVREARRKIAEWEARNGHDSYVDCLNGGYKGYQTACWDCDWRGPEHLRGDEEMDTPESRAHKRNARADAADHRQATQPAASPSEQREGEARGDLAERLEAAAKATVGRHSDLLREAATTIDQQTKVIEAARVITQAVEADNADHFTHGELYGIVRDVQAALRTTEGEDG